MKRNFLLVFIILILLGTGCTNKDVIEENNQNSVRINELESQINSLKEQIKTYEDQQKSDKDERDYYLDYIKNVVSLFPEDQQLALAQSQWKYHINIDDVQIPIDGNVQIDKDNFKITVIEEQNFYSPLPEELKNKGRISGSIFSNHIQFMNTKPNETTGDDGDIISSTTYSFKNLSTGITVNLEISGELQERLGLTTNIITIQITDPNEKENNTEDNGQEQNETNGNEQNNVEEQNKE